MSISLLSKIKFRLQKEKVLVCKLSGTISYGKKDKLFIRDNSSSSVERLIKLFNEITEENKNNYKGILFRIDSPGGSASASEELAREIVKMKNKTKIPLVISVGDLACSGAYEVACTGDYIFANRSSLLGSIGVIMNIPNYKELGEKIGYYSKTIKGGRLKDIGNPFRDMTEEEESYLKSIIEQTHRDFIDFVLSQRPFISNLKEMTDGRIIDAHTAKENHLIDKLGTQFDALDYLISEKLQLSKERVTVIYDSIPKKGLEKLFSMIQIPESINLSLSGSKDISERIFL